MSLREVAAELRRLAAGVREVADQVLKGTHGEFERWAIARDLTATAHTLDRAADVAEHTGIAAGDPASERAAAAADPRRHWPVDHAFGE